jgi:electron-transferring-flavoprotein dehydrogenase
MRDVIEFDVVIVGAGPSGLATACRLMQLANNADRTLSVCVVEKGSEVGAHILSGAVIETRALDELFPDWQVMGAPLDTAVAEDEIYLLNSAQEAWKVPGFLVPKTMHNDGNYIVSLGNLCRWLGEQAEALGVSIFPGFTAAEVLFDDDGCVKGVATGDMGIDADGKRGPNFTEGIDLYGKYTVFAEGCRGHLGKQLIDQFQLDANVDNQHYGLGFKELWDINPELSKPGLVIHGSGWPLDYDSSGGFFLYHLENNQVVVGLIVDLNYRNPWLSPFDEFQRLKHHPVLSQYLMGGKRVSYGARAIAKGGLNSLPGMVFPGGVLVGCNAGTLNFSKIKGTHTAMKSGMIAAEAIAEVLLDKTSETRELLSYTSKLKASWLYDELYRSRNFGAALHKFGTLVGGAFNWIDQNLFAGKLPITLHDRQPDHARLKPAVECERLQYAKPDNRLSFDKLSSVFLSNTNHAENQPCHLKLTDPAIPLGSNLSLYAEPAQRFCPAGVYEIIEETNSPVFQINAQNCIHCKTCDIKDPAQNITWVTPEGSGGPNYPNM